MRNWYSFSLISVLSFFFGVVGVWSTSIPRASIAIAPPQSEPAAITATQYPETRPSDEAKGELNYWPAVVELEGELNTKTFFGPPYFGEDPETDSKERSWILSLNKPINVQGKADPDPGSNTSVENVRELQLVLKETNKKLIGKNVIVRGTLFHAHTGHHHTDVLMEVQAIRTSLPNFLGCWSGMRGGRLRITVDMIKDLGADEESRFTLRRAAAKDRRGLQTGEEYVLEGDRDFPRSFLSKVNVLSFLSDGTVGISTYESYEDYVKDRFVGAGLFEKIDCSEFNAFAR